MEGVKKKAGAVVSILSVQNLSKRYRKHVVIDDITFAIDTPGIWALVGPNGVGKTTFLNLLTNLIPASSGTVRLVGKSNKDYKVFKEVSFLQDNTVLFDYLTGYDHLKYVCDVHRLNKHRVKEIALYVGMESYLHKTVGDYSLGMKQHLLLAMAIVNQPKLLLLDEPLNGLDPTSAILMRKILMDLVASGTTIILSSHNLAEVDRVTKNILFLKDGNLLEENMSDYEFVYYHFEVANKELTKSILAENAYSYTETENGFKVHLEKEYLQSLINLFKETNIEILDIQKEVAGSEKRYAEIFEM